MFNSILKGLSSFFSPGQGWEMFGSLIGILGVVVCLIVILVIMSAILDKLS